MASNYFHKVIKDTPTRLWINKPSGEEMERAIATGAINCTTNPAYCSKLLQSDPDYIRGVIDKVIKETNNYEAAAVRVYEEAARRVMHILRKAVAAGATGLFGYVGPELCIPPLQSVRDFHDFGCRHYKPMHDLVHEAGGLVWVHCHCTVRLRADRAWLQSQFFRRSRTG